MGTGTDRDPASSVEPQTGSPLDEGVNVQLTPADVWVLGQLVEDGSLHLPSEIDDEIRDGYRILRTAGYEPPPTVPSPDTDALGAGPLREVRLAEVSTAEPGPQAAQPGVEAEELTRVAAATPGVDLDLDPVADAHGRLADAVEHLAEEAGGRVHVNVEGLSTSESSTVDGFSRLALDWAVVSLGAILATMFVIASALVSDPVFAFLGIGLLGVTGALAYPYLVGSEGSP